MAASPSRLANVVNRPNRALAPMGSWATSARVGSQGTVGATSTSTLGHQPASSARRWASHPMAAKTSVPVSSACGHHGAHHVDQAAGRGIQGVEQRGGPVGEPRPAVEQVARLEERGQVRLDQPVSSVGQALRTVLGQGGHGHGERAGGDGPRGPGHRGLDGEAVGHRPGERGDAVDARARRHHARHGSASRRPLQPDHAAHGCGHAPEPAVSVPRAMGTWPSATATADPDDEPPGTSAASNGLRGTPYGRAGSHQAGGQLVQVGLAHVERARGQQPLHHGGRLGGHPARPRQAGGGGVDRPRRCCPSGRTARPTGADPPWAPRPARWPRRARSAGSTSIHMAGSSHAAIRASTSSTTDTGSSPSR